MLDKLKRIHPLWWFVAFFVFVNVLWIGPMYLGGGTLKKGTQAPPFTLAAIGSPGRSVSLEELRGTTTVLVFWATWCDSCVAEIPVIEKLASQRPGGANIEILGMNLEPEDRPAVERFLSKHPVSYPNVSVDPATAASYKVKILPTIYVLDPQGQVCKSFTGRVGRTRLEKAILGCGG